MTNMILILIIVFSLLLAVLLAVLFFHPRFPERETPPSLLNRQGSQSEPQMTYDHTQLYPLLKERYTDLDLFMDSEIMKEGILMHWKDAHDSDEKILLDVTEEKSADHVLHLLQRMHWRHTGCAYDLYLLIRNDCLAQKESEYYLRRLISEKINPLAAVLKETDGLVQTDENIFALISKERWPSIDFRTECDPDMCRQIAGKYKAKMPWKRQRPEDLKELKKQLPKQLLQKTGSSPENMAKVLPFMEIYYRPVIELTGEENNILRLTACMDDQLEEGIACLAGIFEKSGLAYGIARENRSGQNTRQDSPFTAALAKALCRMDRVIPLNYGDAMTEGWPGIDTAGFAPYFKNRDTAKETIEEFYRTLLESETAEH